MSSEKFASFVVNQEQDKYVFIETNIDDKNKLFNSLFDYFFDDTKLLRCATNTITVELSKALTKKQKVEIFKTIREMIDQENEIQISTKEIAEIADTIQKEFTFTEDNGQYKIRLDKIGKIGEYIFSNLLYDSKENLLLILKQFQTGLTKISRAAIVKKILEMSGKPEYELVPESSLINLLINKNRYSIKQVLDEYISNLPIANNSYNIDTLISKCLKLKFGHIENAFYKNAKVILYFLQCEKVDVSLIEIFKNQIIDTVDYIYFKGVAYAKELLEMGIYYKDIDTIVTLLDKEKQMDAGELTRFLKSKEPNISITFLSRYVIKNL